MRLVSIFLFTLFCFESSGQSVFKDYSTDEDLRGLDLYWDFDSRPQYTHEYIETGNHRHVFRFKNTRSLKLKGRQGLSHLLAISFHIKPRGRDLNLVVYPRDFAGLSHGFEESGNRFRVRFKNQYPTREDLDPKREYKIICIDPGHGGHDPGAQGQHSNEKELALDISMELQEELNQRKGMKAFLTRRKDYKIKLEDRPKISDRAESSVFISLHLNASIPKVHGYEVFYVSDKGADQTLRKNLKDGTLKEAIQSPGVPAKSQDIVRQILLDMQQVETMNSSSLLAQTVAQSLKKTGRRARGVRRAAFVVLKTLNTPSILVEMGFITNPSEEAYFRSKQKRASFVEGLADGIERFLSMPMELRVAQTSSPVMKPARSVMRQAKPKTWTYKVKDGDTLGGIAIQNKVRFSDLLEANPGVEPDRIFVGQKIEVPTYGRTSKSN